MTQDVVSVQPDMHLKDVARLLVERRVSGVPVLDDGRVLGIVSEADLLINELGPDGVARRPLARLLGESQATREQFAKVEARTAGEAMSTPAITITADRPVTEAAATMTDRGINRLVVVDDDALVGIITRADIVRAYVRTDDELAETVREAISYKTLWKDPGAVEVTVHDGNVSIRGRVERRSTAAMVQRIAEMIPGVVGATADVDWEFDDQPMPGG
jgi:CBS domain-containing protein